MPIKVKSIWLYSLQPIENIFISGCRCYVISSNIAMLKVIAFNSVFKPVTWLCSTCHILTDKKVYLATCANCEWTNIWQSITQPRRKDLKNKLVKARDYAYRSIILYLERSILFRYSSGERGIHFCPNSSGKKQQ